MKRLLTIALCGSMLASIPAAFADFSYNCTPTRTSFDEIGLRINADSVKLIRLGSDLVTSSCELEINAEFNLRQGLGFSPPTEMAAACTVLASAAIPDFGNAIQLIGAVIDKKLLKGAKEGSFSLRIKPTGRGYDNRGEYDEKFDCQWNN